MNLKSKITWISIISLVITIVGALQPVFPQWAVYTSAGVSILTIILRQLQGQTLSIGNSKFTL
jgi:hypothetical protein